MEEQNDLRSNLWRHKEGKRKLSKVSHKLRLTLDMQMMSKNQRRVHDRKQHADDCN